MELLAKKVEVRIKTTPTEVAKFEASLMCVVAFFCFPIFSLPSVGSCHDRQAIYREGKKGASIVYRVMVQPCV